jgi:small-conductance mechanosensitive channel
MSKNGSKGGHKPQTNQQPAKKPIVTQQAKPAQSAPAQKPAQSQKPAAAQEASKQKKPKATRAESMAASFGALSERLGKVAGYYQKMTSPEAQDVARQLLRAQEQVETAKAASTKVPKDAPPAEITVNAIVKLPATVQERYKTLRPDVKVGEFKVLVQSEGRVLIESEVSGFQMELAERGLILVRPAVPTQAEQSNGVAPQTRHVVTDEDVLADAAV